MSIITRIHNNKKQYRFMAYYKDFEGNRKKKGSKWYDTRKECIVAESEFKNSLNPKRNTINVTFEEIATDWIRLHEENNKNDTVTEKKYIIGTFCQSLNNKKIDCITPVMLKNLFKSDLICHYSTSYKNKIYLYIKSVFDHAQKFYGLATNPMLAIPTFKKTDSERLQEMKIWTPREFNLFKKSLEPDFHEYANYFHLLFWTGMRKNEARSLTFADFDGKSFRIYRQLNRQNEFVTLKSKGSSRTVSLDKATLSVILEQMDKYSCMRGFASDWFVFGGFKPLSRTGIDNAKKRGIMRSKVEPIRIHDFRHSHASYLIEKGVNMYKISKRLGHSSITITLDRYGHLMDSEESEILKAIEN